MAAKNWRENSEATAPKTPKRSSKPTNQGDSMSLGPIVRAFALVLIAGIIGILVWWLFIKVQPKSKTAVYLENTTQNDLPVNPFATAIFADEIFEQVASKNDNLRIVRKAGDDANSFGPQKNTVLYYFTGDLAIDSEDQLRVSKNFVEGGNRYDSDSWEPLQKIITTVCEGQQKLNRVLFLDIGHCEESLRMSSPTVEQRIETMLKEMSSTKNINQLWILVSASGKQRSWYAPELGTSVFSFFVTQGLAGSADIEDENTSLGKPSEISLKELFDYVKGSVSRWARDYRQSSQLPALVSLADPDGVSVIYGNSTPDDVLAKFTRYKAAELDRYWESLASLKESRTHSPHLLAMIESRLLKLEEVRYCSNSDFRSQKIFTKLDEQIDFLISNKVPKATTVDQQMVSLTQVDSSDSSLNSVLDDWKNYLYPPPAEKTDTEGGADEDNDAEKKPAPATAPQERPPSLENLRKLDRQRLIWAFLGDNHQSPPPLTPQIIKQCIDYVVERENEPINPKLNGESVDFTELRFLKILYRGIDWSSDREQLNRQIAGFVAAINSRQKSESLIQGSFLGRDFPNRVTSHARNWPLVRQDYAQLENQRRSIEDDLLANQMNSVSTDFAKLMSDYDALANRLQTVIQLRQHANEALHIAPHLRSFLIKEASLRATCERVESALEGLNRLERLAIEIQVDLNSESPDFTQHINNLTSLTNRLNEIRDQFTTAYYDNHLLNPDSKESVFVFDGLNMLTSPIPEWLADGKNSERATIRRNVDEWIQNQRNTIQEQKRWLNIPESGELADANDTITLEKYRQLMSGVPKYEFRQLAISKLSESLTTTNTHLQPYKAGGAIFQDNFAYKNQPLTNLQDLLDWHQKLSLLDFEIRAQNQRLSILGEPLDNGPQLEFIDQIIVANDRLVRARSDFWGDGDVTRVVGNPSFCKYTELLHQPLEFCLGELASFKSLEDKETKAFDTSQLLALFDQRIVDTKELWNRWQKSELSWPSKPDAYFQDQKFSVNAKVESEVEPQSLHGENQLTMGSRLLIDGSPEGPMKAFDYSGTGSALATIALQLAEKSGKVSARSILRFRGHVLSREFELTQGIVPEPVRVVLDTRYSKPTPGVSKIQITNSRNNTADVVFILDYSYSMVDKKNEIEGILEEGGEVKKRPRLEYAKGAFTTAATDLFGEKRFRLGLYAFGHRVGFVGKRKDPNTGRFRLSNPSYHPFNDSEVLHHLTEDLGDDVNRLLEKIPQKAQGITPLYFSIKKAIQEQYFETDSDRPRYIVAITDGENNQIDTPSDPKATLPPGKSVSDATTRFEVRDLIARHNVRLLIARMKKPGPNTAEESRELKELEEAGAIVLPVLENDSAKISEAILDRIGRNEYSLTPASAATPGVKERISLKPESETNVRGDFTVETFGVEKPDKFNIELLGDETVSFENTREGLVLVEPKPNYLRSSGGQNGKVTIKLGQANYNIGRLKPSIERELWFGLNKLNFVDDETRNFSFRPQRIWAQVTDRETGIRSSLFLPVYDSESFPFAQFGLPPALQDRPQGIDVCLWIVPNQRDKPALNSADSTAQNIGLNQVTNIAGLKCEHVQDGTTHRIKVTSSIEKDPRGYFVICPEYESFSRSRLFLDNELTEDVFEFQVDSRNVSFSMNALPHEEFDAIVSRVEQSTERTGEDQDPIFGGQATWVKFENVRTKNR